VSAKMTEFVRPFVTAKESAFASDWSFEFAFDLL
jgi:hypothetical protein